MSEFNTALRNGEIKAGYDFDSEAGAPRFQISRRELELGYFWDGVVRPRKLSFEAGGHIPLANARFAYLHHRLSKEERDKYYFKITSIRECLHGEAFLDWASFASFWRTRRGYVEEAISWDHGRTFFLEWMRSTRNPLNVKACIVNLHSIVGLGARVRQWDPQDKNHQFLESLRSYGDYGAVIMIDIAGVKVTPDFFHGLVHEGQMKVLAMLRQRQPEVVTLNELADCLFTWKLDAESIRQLVEYLESQQPGLVAARIDAYLESVENSAA